MSKNRLIKILFLAADPQDITRLRLGQEIREIREKLQLSQYRDTFVLETRESVRPPDITQAIHDIQPQIVHFSGHGGSTGELYFEDFLGNAFSVKPEALANLFSLIADQVSCVILNACYSDIQAKAIGQHIPYVIGMNKAIGDKAAIAFSSGFYKALGANKSIEQAFKFGCVELQLYGIPEHLTPTLISQLHPSVTERITTQLQEVLSGSISNRLITEKITPQLEKAPFANKFKNLEELLVAAAKGVEQAWREADDETRSVMLQIAKRQQQGWLDPESIKKFPCQDLKAINKLWTHYSNNRFGFSIQQRIYLECGGQPDGKYYEDAWQRFALRVGWRNRRNWILASDVIYSISAPEGHLPTGKGMAALDVHGWYKRIICLAARVRCKLDD
jgi:hypothetical protein